MHVELAAGLVPRPRRAPEERGPVVRLVETAEAVAHPVAPQIPVAEWTRRISTRRLEPAMRRARVVHYEVEQDPDATPVRLRHQPIEVVKGAEERIDRVVVRHVVADVEPRRRMDGREPDCVDAERSIGPVVQVIQVRDQPGKVADAVVVRVGERARIDLVNDPSLPPIPTERGAKDRWNGTDSRARLGSPCAARGLGHGAASSVVGRSGAPLGLTPAYDIGRTMRRARPASPPIRLAHVHRLRGEWLELRLLDEHDRPRGLSGRPARPRGRPAPLLRFRTPAPAARLGDCDRPAALTTDRAQPRAPCPKRAVPVCDQFQWTSSSSWTPRGHPICGR